MHLRFGRGKLKTPTELASRVETGLAQLNERKSERSVEKAMEDISIHLEQMKVVAVGIDDRLPNKEQSLALAQEAAKKHLVKHLVLQLSDVDFETRKDIGLVLGAFLRVKTEEKTYPIADYIAANPVVLHSLMSRYGEHGNPHIGLIAGSILRDCIRHENLAREIATSSLLLQFFEEFEERKFEIAADAFETFREVILRHKDMIGAVLLERFETFFPKMKTLIQSENFFIRRQSLKLLSEILLGPENAAIVRRYVRDVQNLMMLMNLLRDKYDSIQFEAFHSFKVFLVGDDKAPEVLDILQKNKSKLLHFFSTFQTEKAEADEGFREELGFVRELIEQIPD